MEVTKKQKRIMNFRQKPFFRDFIDINTNLRGKTIGVKFEETGAKKLSCTFYGTQWRIQDKKPEKLRNKSQK